MWFLPQTPMNLCGKDHNIMWKRPQYYVKKTTGFRFFFLLEEEV